MAVTTLFPYKDKAAFDFEQTWQAQAFTPTITYGEVPNASTGNSNIQMYIGFDFGQVPTGVINSVRLQIFFESLTNTLGTYYIYSGSGAWAENNNQTGTPVIDLSQAASTPRGDGAGWVDIDVTSLFTFMRSNSRDTFIGRADSNLVGRFQSREGSNPPRLVIDYTPPDVAKPADPNPTVVYGTTTATITWNAFNDPAPSSGRATTDFYLGQWNGTSYTNLLFNGVDVGNITSKTVTGLVPGARYRYTVTYHDNVGNESFFTYKEFITKKQVGEDHIKNNAGQVVVVPLYDPASGVLGNKAYRKALNNGVVGCYELVPTTDPNAAHIHVQTSTGIMSLSK